MALFSKVRLNHYTKLNLGCLLYKTPCMALFSKVRLNHYTKLNHYTQLNHYTKLNHYREALCVTSSNELGKGVRGCVRVEEILYVVNTVGH
jgi:hypothetical protein